MGTCGLCQNRAATSSRREEPAAREQAPTTSWYNSAVFQMATCPRCLGALSDGHRCRPIWVKRLWRQVVASLLGGLFGVFLQLLIVPGPVPVVGPVLGALFFFGINEAIRPE